MQTLPVHDYSLDYTSAMPSVPHLGLVQTAVIFTGLVVGGLMGHWRRPTEMLLAVGVAAALFMVSPESRVVWDMTPGLATFQFPWRFLGIVAILGGLIAGRLALFRTYGAPIALALSIAVIVAGMWVQVVPREWPTYRGPPADAGEFERRTGIYALTSDDEFLPTWVKRVRFTLFDSIRTDGTSGAAIGEVKLVEAQQSHWQFEITTAEPTTMTLDMFYFPNWRATIDGKPAETRAVSDLGLLGIDVPAGSHRDRGLSGSDCVGTNRVGGIRPRTAAPRRAVDMEKGRDSGELDAHRDDRSRRSRTVAAHSGRCASEATAGVPSGTPRYGTGRRRTAIGRPARPEAVGVVWDCRLGIVVRERRRPSRRGAGAEGSIGRLRGTGRGRKHPRAGSGTATDCDLAAKHGADG